jgi:type III secretion protein J
MNQKLPTGFKKLFPTSWLFSEAAFVLVVLFGIIVFAMSGCESQKTIVNGLDEREANEILVLLASKDINAYKIRQKAEAGGGAQKEALWDIAVDSDSAVEAMSLLNTAGLPRRRGQNLLQLFSAGGLVPSDLQEKIRYQAGLADQIANTIRKIDGIVDADVQLSFPEEDPLNPNKPKGQVTASVYVKHTGVLDDPNSHLITKIKRLVSSSVNNLPFDNVTVIPDKARFSEASMTQEPTAEPTYVRVWSIVVAKDSLKRFQMTFFAFCIIIFLLVLAAGWLVWKIYPLTKKRGGMMSLFHFSPLPDTFEEAPKEELKKEEADAKTQDAKKEPKVQENVENT